MSFLRKKSKKIINNMFATILVGLMMVQSCSIVSYADYYSYSDKYGDFLEALGKRESDNTYNIVNSRGYMGRWQLGMLSLQDVGFVDEQQNWTPLSNSFGVYDKETFLNSKQCQDYAIYKYHLKNWYYINRMGLNDYIGTTTVDGQEVTPSSLLAISHLIGVGSLKNYLEGETEVDEDVRNHIIEYTTLFGNYDIQDTIINQVPFTEVCNCSNLDGNNQYIVNSDELMTYIYDGHGIYNQTIGSIDSGTIVNVTKSDGVWGHISLENGEEGYISMLNLTKINDVSIPTVGDLNSDQSVDTIDLILLKKHIINHKDVSTLNIADVNNDGKVNVLDITTLKRMIIN